MTTPKDKNAQFSLGQFLEGHQPRDAIHMAVISATCGEALLPGYWVDLVSVTPEGGLQVKCSDEEKLHGAIGIVDPFLPFCTVIPSGQTFWVFIKPNTIDSLRHTWTHPKIPATATIGKTPGAGPTEAELLAKYNNELLRAYKWADVAVSSIDACCPNEDTIHDDREAIEEIKDQAVIDLVCGWLGITKIMLEHYSVAWLNRGQKFVEEWAKPLPGEVTWERVYQAMVNSRYRAIDRLEKEYEEETYTNEEAIEPDYPEPLFTTKELEPEGFSQMSFQERKVYYDKWRAMRKESPFK